MGLVLYLVKLYIKTGDTVQMVKRRKYAGLGLGSRFEKG
jgi:hypothetical protein